MSPQPFDRLATDYVFVYGTLKRGFCRHGVLANQIFVSDATTLRDYVLFNLGDYPGLVETNLGEGSSVEGEIYQVDVPTLKRLDEIEGVVDGLYERRSVRLAGEETLNLGRDVQAYFYLGSTNGLPVCGNCWT